jgi:hypothetical protein
MRTIASHLAFKNFGYQSAVSRWKISRRRLECQNAQTEAPATCTNLTRIHMNDGLDH